VFSPFGTKDVFKDAREILQFENRIKVAGAGHETSNNTGITYVESEELIKKSYLFNDSFATPKILCGIGGGLHEATDLEVIHYADYVRLNFKYPTTGTLDQVFLSLDDEPMLRRYINPKSVTSGESAWVTVSVSY